MPRMSRRIRLALLGAVICAIAAPASAQQLFNNWNAGPCVPTSVATFTIQRPVRVQRIDVWFRWRADETSIGYAASHDGAVIANGELSRVECDPHQAAWCIARVEPDADLEPGTYTFRLARAGICQNRASGNQGFIRAYGAGQ